MSEPLFAVLADYVGEERFGSLSDIYGVPGHCYTIDGDWWHSPGTCDLGHDCCGPRADVLDGGDDE